MTVEKFLGINLLLIRLSEQHDNKNNKRGETDAFSYVSVLVFVVIIGLFLNTGSAYWSTVIKREKEKELLFRGEQIRRAIESYFNGSPGGGGSQYPASFNDLLKDPRYLATRRYLRKIYKDPMTKDGQWGILRAPGDRIKGVYSTSEEKPLKVGNFPERYKIFEKADKYSDWRFVYPNEIDAESPSVSGKIKEEELLQPVQQESEDEKSAEEMLIEDELEDDEDELIEDDLEDDEEIETDDEIRTMD